jgi:2-polyprenyl-6-methoxyphenol hydroxylase-like FAD-dependent oxidoreductase
MAKEIRMTHRPLKAIIIGAGTGGLTLAQGLRAARVAVEVYEREQSPADRQQGYRLSINPAGCRALKACLPDAVFAKFIASSARSSENVTFLDHHLKRLLAIDVPRNPHSDVDNERPIGRLALRQVLLEGLGEVVHFGKKFAAFEETPDGRVTARFDDGSTASGDVLIGADGASSRVCRQLLPGSKRVETGISVISGKLGLNGEQRDQIPAPIRRGPTLILGHKGHFMFASAVEYDKGKTGGGDGADTAGSNNREEYVTWGVSTRQAAFAPVHLDTLNGGELKAAALALMTGWDPALRHLVEKAAESSLVTFPVKTSVPIAPWPTRSVTLLGDALHNMTPYRGVGANTALRDADALRKALVSVDRGENALLPALAAYERDMIDYGFKAVGVSLDMMKRVHSESAVGRAFAKLFFRTVDRIKPLQPMLFGRD